MIAYWSAFHDRLLLALFQHVTLVLTALLLALVIALALIFILVHNQKWFAPVLYFFSALYAIPSYAFFALLIPLTGLGATTAVLVLSLYSEYILLRSFATGIQQIDPNLAEAARGMGMTPQQIFYKIQLPLAIKSFFSGLHLALTALIGIATIAATINAGGLGTLLFDGLRTQSAVKIIWGGLLTVVLCMVSSFILKIIERITIKKLALEEIS